VEPEIRPEPSEDERRAILLALAQDERSEPSLYRTRWREAAFEEGVADDAAEPGSSTIPD
jgi:hypothetical protein